MVEDDKCITCGTDTNVLEDHAKVCTLGESEWSSVLQPKALDLILSELFPAHAQQIRNGIRTLETSTIPGDVVMRIVVRALMSKSDV